MVQREAVRVIIDAHMLGSGETGNETYVANLLPNLAESSDDRYAVAVTTDTRLPADLKIAGIQVLPLRPPGDLARLFFSLPALCRRWHADVLHVTYVGPLVLPCRLVVSLHDVSFKRYPKFFSPRDRILFATLLPLTLRRASAVITLSEHARQEVLGHYPYLDGRVHVTYLAPAAEFRLQPIDCLHGLSSLFLLANLVDTPQGCVKESHHFRRFSTKLREIRRRAWDASPSRRTEMGVRRARCSGGPDRGRFTIGSVRAGRQAVLRH